MKKRASSKRSLVDDDDDAADSTNQLTINEDFAKRYEQKKKIEEVSQAKDTIKRLEEELSSDESEDEDEDEVGLLDPVAEDQFLRILPLLAKKDPKLYDKGVTFFPPAAAAPAPADHQQQQQQQDVGAPVQQQQQQGAGAPQPFLLKNYVKGSVRKPTGVEDKAAQATSKKHRGGEQQEKPLLLKDFIRETLLKEGSEGLLESDDDDDDKSVSKAGGKGLTHVEEQELLKKQFLAEAGTVGRDADEDDFLKLRSKNAEEQEREAQEDLEFWKAEEQRTGVKQASGDDVLSSFWLSGDLDPNERFLRNYILNNGWIDKEEGRVPTYDQILKEDEEDEEALEQQEEFEMKHQEAVTFHYLEEGGDRIVTHPRVIEDSVRRKDSKRAQKREKRKEKKAKERAHKEEELKRIKNLMKESMKKQLAKIRETSGTDALGLEEEFLEEEFDPAEHDRKMAAAFNDDYYEGAGDEEEPPAFADEADENYQHFGLANTAGSLLGQKAQQRDDDDDEEEEVVGAEAAYGEEEEEEEETEEKEEKKKKKKDKVDQLLEKYYALNFEDLIAGEIPCRFKYRQVKPKSYGMDVATILSTPDAELNRRVSLKKLAPYRHLHRNRNAERRAKKRLEKQRGVASSSSSSSFSREEGTAPAAEASSSSSTTTTSRSKKRQRANDSSEYRGRETTKHKKKKE